MWAKEAATTPVIVKLTPNITDITATAGCGRGGADAISLINTINSLAGVDIDSWNTIPHVGGKGSHGGYCGPAVKPIALNMVAECARNPEDQCSDFRHWRHFKLAGCGGVYADGCDRCSNLYGSDASWFRIVEDMIDGLSNYLDE